MAFLAVQFPGSGMGHGRNYINHDTLWHIYNRISTNQQTLAARVASLTSDHVLLHNLMPGAVTVPRSQPSDAAAGNACSYSRDVCKPQQSMVVATDLSLVAAQAP